MNLSTSFLMTVWLMLAVGIGQETPKQAVTDSSTKSNDVKGAASPVSRISGNDAEYKIGPQDLLRIDVWKEVEITRTVPVRPDGKISLPLLNDVQAAGLTPMELSGVISDGLKKFMTNPQVTVTVAEINSRRVYVTGEVARPGAFPLLPNMKVLHALSSAGGFTQFAKLRGIYVLRMEEGKQVKYPFNYKEVVSGKKSDQDILLQPGDVIVVP